MKKWSYYQWAVLLLLAALLILSPFEAKADGTDGSSPSGETDPTGQDTSIDWSKYSYDDLLLLRDDLNEYIREAERQYAIENGNRTITLSDKEITLYNRKTYTLKAEVKRVVEDAPAKTTLKWSSSNESVAKVSNTGVITGVGYGDATITCRAADDEYIFAESVCHVVLPVTGLTINNADVTLLLSGKDTDGTTTLSCTVKPSNAHVKDVTWTSSNTAVVTVDKKGVLKAVAPGTATITARSKDPEASSVSATCRVTVVQAVSKITLNKTTLSLNINTNETLTATVLPANATNKRVTWESSNTKVATVTNAGMVRAVSPGTAKISCVAADGSGVLAECTVKCVQMVTSVKIESNNQRTITLNKDKSSTLKTTILPANATDKSLTWSSSDPKVVTVTDTGTIKAVSGGSATITCTTKDGSKKTASIEVYVPSIAVDRTSYTVTAKTGLDITIKYYGKSSNFSSTVTPTGVCKVKTKQSGNTITLSITPQKAGTATITLKDSADRRSETKITVEIAHSACYDTASYPTGDYKKILRKPSSYKGKNMSIYGKVVQIGTSWFSTYMRVATKSGYDNVFYIECSSDVASGIIEDDYVTIYGVCSGTETYTTIFGASVTIPSIEAEKIVRGRK